MFYVKHAKETNETVIHQTVLVKMVITMMIILKIVNNVHFNV